MKSLSGKRLTTLLGIDNSDKIVEMVKDILGYKAIGRKFPDWVPVRCSGLFCWIRRRLFVPTCPFYQLFELPP